LVSCQNQLLHAAGTADGVEGEGRGGQAVRISCSTWLEQLIGRREKGGGGRAKV